MRRKAQKECRKARIKERDAYRRQLHSDLRAKDPEGVLTGVTFRDTWRAIRTLMEGEPPTFSNVLVVRNSIARRCREQELNYDHVLGYMKQGKTFDEAAAMPPKKGHWIKQAAKTHSISHKLLSSRIGKHKKTLAEALTMGPRPTKRKPSVFTSSCIEAGMCPETVKARIAAGLSSLDAIATPLRPGSKHGTINVSALARDHGLSPNTVWVRLGAGWTLNRALNTPKRSKLEKSFAGQT